MKRGWRAGPTCALLVMAMPAWSADDPRIGNLALCRDSWLDWKDTAPSQLESFGAFLRSDFAHNDADAFLTPKSATTVYGLKVIQLFPGSLGMGLGFSVLVDAPMDVARRTLERELGKPFRTCETSDGAQTCELSIAKLRTVILASGDPSINRTTLIGCYYYYEK